MTSRKRKQGHARRVRRYWPLGLFSLSLLLGFVVLPSLAATRYVREDGAAAALAAKPAKAEEPKTLDTALYDKKLQQLANYASTTSTTTPRLWPAKGNPYPLPGALLPFKRIIAYYGNFYSKNMGVLGEYPEATVIQKLQNEVARWNSADPATPAIPAIDYIVVTAQGSPGQDGKYRLRMPSSEIDKAVALASKVNGIVILDVQVGLSNLPAELPRLEPYLKLPQVHLAIDPEFSMKSGEKPGTVIGTFNSADVNYAVGYLAGLVRQNHLPPKVLIVHRFTRNMVTGASSIKPLPEVQVVMDMDGWGSGAKKINTYKSFIYPEPVQFTGFKLFYKNDLKPPSTGMLTPSDLMKLTPRPSFIQYQ